MENLKHQRAIEKVQKEVDGLENQTIHLPPEQRYTFHYLSSEYLALGKLLNFIRRQGMFDTDIYALVTKHSIYARELLVSEFNVIQSALSAVRAAKEQDVLDSGQAAERIGETNQFLMPLGDKPFVMMPQHVDSHRANISIHPAVHTKIAEAYQQLTKNPITPLPEKQYSKRTRQWLGMLVEYRKSHPEIDVVNNSALVAWTMIQHLGSQLPELIENTINQWINDLEANNVSLDATTVKNTATSALLYVVNNMLLLTALTTREELLGDDSIERISHFDETALNQGRYYENEYGNGVSDATRLVQMSLFAEMDSGIKLTEGELPELLRILFRQVLNKQQSVLIIDSETRH